MARLRANSKDRQEADPFSPLNDVVAETPTLDKTTGIFRGEDKFDPIKTREKLEAQGRVRSGVG